MTEPFLVLLDVDGTLQDAQGAIVESVRVAFAEGGLVPPPRDSILRTVGLTVPRMMEALAPGAEDAVLARLVSDYRLRFAKVVAHPEQAAPLFPGVAEGLDRLEEAGATLGLATGKSRRGLAAFLDAHGWRARFATIQNADTNPSKPHPSMVRNALAETGIAPGRAVMIGDTTFDMEMARAGGIAAVAVSHGYHDPGTLHRAGASVVADGFPAAVAAALERLG